MSPEEVRDALAAAGLDPDAFDAAATAADLEERTALNDTLDELVAARPTEPALRFDACWP